MEAIIQEKQQNEVLASTNDMDDLCPYECLSESQNAGKDIEASVVDENRMGAFVAHKNQEVEASLNSDVDSIDESDDFFSDDGEFSNSQMILIALASKLPNLDRKGSQSSNLREKWRPENNDFVLEFSEISVSKDAHKMFVTRPSLRFDGCDWDLNSFRPSTTSSGYVDGDSHPYGLNKGNVGSWADISSVVALVGGRHRLLEEDLIFDPGIERLGVGANGSATRTKSGKMLSCSCHFNLTLVICDVHQRLDVRQALWKRRIWAIAWMYALSEVWLLKQS